MISNKTFKKISICFLITMAACLFMCFVISCIKFSPILNFKAGIDNAIQNDPSGNSFRLYVKDRVNSYLLGLVFYMLCYLISLIVCCFAIYLTVKNKTPLVFVSGIIVGLLSLANVASSSSFICLINVHRDEFQMSSTITDVRYSLIVSIVILVLTILSCIFRNKIIKKVLVFISFGIFAPIVWINYLYVFFESGIDYSITFLCTFALSLIGFVSVPISILPKIVIKHRDKKVRQPSTKPKVNKKFNTKNPIETLKELKKLFDNGILTQEEYDEKKQKYIDML